MLNSDNAAIVTVLPLLMVVSVRRAKALASVGTRAKLGEIYSALGRK